LEYFQFLFHFLLDQSQHKMFLIVKDQLILYFRSVTDELSLQITELLLSNSFFPGEERNEIAFSLQYHTISIILEGVYNLLSYSLLARLSYLSFEGNSPRLI